MTDTFIDKVYGVTAPEDLRTLYDDWATKYDAELQSLGYVTPDRIAEALAKHLDDKNAPILDFACGTGLSGQALAQAGFTRIDGADLSSEMLEEAYEKGVYRKLRQVSADGKLPCMQGDYHAIVAAGAISPGAAPIAVFDKLLAILSPGGLMAFSFNDHALEDPAYTEAVDAAIRDGRAAEKLREHGPHLSGIDLGATVYILEKL